MGFFDKLFNYKKPSSTSKRSKETTDKESASSLEDQSPNLQEFVLQQFEANNLQIEIIREDYLKPYLEGVLKNDYQNNLYQNDPKAYENKYFMLFSISYLAYHHPEDKLIGSILKYILSEGQSNHDAREMIRSGVRHEFSEHPEKQAVVNTGAGILLIYHALYVKIEHNFSNASQVHSILNGVRSSGNKNDFTTLLIIATRQTTYETLWILIHTLIYKKYDYRTKAVSTDSDKKAEVLEKIHSAIADFNKTYHLALSVEDLGLIGEYIVSVEMSETFLKADYKTRKKFGLKEMTELSSFVGSAKARMPTFMDAWLYFGSFYFSSNLAILFKEITVSLLAESKWSVMDFERWISLKNHIGKDHCRSFHMPLFDSYVRSANYTERITAAFENYFYTYFGINESKTIPKKIAAGFSQISEDNPNTLEREFKKLVYKSPVSVSNLKGESFGLYTGSKNTREEGVLSIHSQFNSYVPSSVKSVNKGQYYQEDHELFVLNIDGEDYHIPSLLSGALNKILESRRTGVRVVPVPIAQSVDYRGFDRFVTTLCLINLSQFRYLTEQYIPARFPELRNAKAYQSITFFTTNAEALHERHANDTFVGEAEIFSAGYANDVKWSWFKEAYTDKLKSKQKWNKAMDVLTAFTGTARPSSKWVSDMNKVIDEMGEAQYFDELGSLIYESREEKSWFFDEYNKTLKGMIWSCTLRSTERSLLIIKTVTELSYTKVMGVGPRSTKTGNFCMEALANSPSEIAYGILQLMRIKSKYPRFVKALDKFIEKYKENNKGNIEELEDKALPDFGFKNGVKIYDFIDAKLEVSLVKGKIIKTYLVNGKPQKKIPDIINQHHSARLKEVTAEIKQIAEIFKALHARLKTFWMYDRSWKFGDWNKYIFNHPLMNALVENMVWVGVDSEELFISKADSLIQTNGATIELDENEVVSLWHPIQANLEEIEELKKYFYKNKLHQLEKQVEREYYRFSQQELEDTQSDRFANLSLAVRKLMALAHSAGWIFTYVHEDVSWPRVYLKELDVTAHFKCDYNRSADFIPTAEFFFSKGDSSKISYNSTFNKLKLCEIPDTTLSEVFRDIDMFVSVANQDTK